MAEFSDILAAFEENLVLARELGARSFEMDRALLAPPSPVSQTSAPVEIGLSKPSAALANEIPAPRRESEPVKEPPPRPSARNAAPAVEGAATLVLFIGVKMEGAALELYRNMVAAMGCGEGEVRLVEVPCVSSKEAADELFSKVAALQPKAIVVLGREATHLQMLAGGTARRGAWGAFCDVPAIATYHPAHMLRFWADDKTSMLRAKAAVWNTLKEVLGRVGRTPPERK